MYSKKSRSSNYQYLHAYTPQIQLFFSASIFYHIFVNLSMGSPWDQIVQNLRREQAPAVILLYE